MSNVPSTETLLSGGLEQLRWFGSGRKAKLASLACGLGLHQHCRTTTKAGFPACGSGHVVDDRVDLLARLGATKLVPTEHGIAHTRSVALKIDPGQSEALRECTRPDVGDAGRDRDTGQARAAGESPRLNARDAVRDRDVCQAAATSERKLPKASDAVWDCDAREADATAKTRSADIRDVFRDRNTRKTDAGMERQALKPHNTVGNRVMPLLSARILDERGLGLVKQDPIGTAVA